MNKFAYLMGRYAGLAKQAGPSDKKDPNMMAGGLGSFWNSLLGVGKQKHKDVGYIPGTGSYGVTPKGPSMAKAKAEASKRIAKNKADKPKVPLQHSVAVEEPLPVKPKTKGKWF